MAAALASALGACSDDGGDPEAFCAGIEEIADVEALIGGVAAEQDPGTSMRNAAQRMRQLSGEAPDEIDGDVRRIADAVELLAEAAADPDIGVAARLSEIDLEAVGEAAANVERYARDECGIDLSSTSTTAAATPSTQAPGG